MDARSLPLHALKHFEAAARLGSFKKAASELNVTPGAVSQQIRELEAFLNVALFERRVREVLLTDRGKYLSLVATQAINDLSRGVREIRGVGSRRTELRVEVGPFFSQKFLVPRLAKFIKAHPKIDVHLQHIRSEFESDTDVSIRWGRGKWARFDSEKLFDVYMQPVCKAGIGSSAGRPSDLKGWRLLHCQSRDDWRHWLESSGYDGDLARLGPILDEPNIAYQAAAAGLGYGIGYLPLIGKDLRSDGMEFAHPRKVQSQDTYFLLRSPGRDFRAASIFCTWLLTEIKASGLSQYL